MKIKPEDLYQSPNKLAKFYSKFRVDERMLFTGHSHQAWPDCGFEAQQEAWNDAAEFVDDKWEKAFAKAEEVKQGISSNRFGIINISLFQFIFHFLQ